MTPTLVVTKGPLTGIPHGTTQVSLAAGTLDVGGFDALGVAFLTDGVSELRLHDMELGNLTNAVPVHGRKAWKSATLENLNIHDIIDGDALHLPGGQQTITDTVVRNVRIANVKKGPKLVHADGISCMSFTKGLLLEHITLENCRALFLPPQTQTADPGTLSGQATVGNAHEGLVLRDWEVSGTEAFIDIFSAPGVRLERVNAREVQLQRLQGAKGGRMPPGATETDGTRDVVMIGCTIPVLQVGGDNPAARAILAGVTFSPECGGCRVGRITGLQAGEEEQIRAVLERPIDSLPDDPPVVVPPTPTPEPVPDPLADIRARLAGLEAGLSDLKARVGALGGGV